LRDVRRRCLRRLAAGIAALALASCAVPEYPNQPLAAGAANPEGRGLDTAAGRPVIVMAFSGGGSRAAALALAVLQELRRYGDGGPPARRLIDDVAVVSSVSGGSVTAAYFGLYGADGLDGLVPDFLARDNMATLELQGASPVTWLRLVFGSYTRIDALRDLFDRQLFHGKTFAELNQPGRPFVILNASDMGSGEVFSFTAERFNDICSDLRSMPVSVGVAASAAFPVLLSPVDLQNHATACPGSVPSDAWIAKDLQSRYTRYLNIEEYKLARYANALRHGPDPFRDIDYVHLLDGGLEDNLGIHSVVDAIASPHGAIRLLDAINSGDISHLAVITVNARSDPPNAVNQEAATPGIVSVLSSVIGNPIDAATADVAGQLRDLIVEINQAAANAPPEAKAKFVAFHTYNIEIDFDQLLPDQAALRDTVKAIPTLWTVTQDQLAALDQVGIVLLRQHPCFQKLLLDLKVPAAFADPGFASQACL
jgi:NTE family protein